MTAFPVKKFNKKVNYNKLEMRPNSSREQLRTSKETTPTSKICNTRSCCKKKKIISFKLKFKT